MPARACWFESSQGHQAEGGPSLALLCCPEVRQDWAHPFDATGLPRREGKPNSDLASRRSALVSRTPSTSPGDTSSNGSASLRLWTWPSYPASSVTSPRRRRSSVGRDGRLGADGDSTRGLEEVAYRGENSLTRRLPFLARRPPLRRSPVHTSLSVRPETPSGLRLPQSCVPQRVPPFTSSKLPKMTGPHQPLLSAGIRLLRSKGE